MSETPDTSTESIPAAGAAEPATPVVPIRAKSSRLNVVAAWVGIVAGAVLIVAIIFWTGFMLGAHSGKHHGGGGFDRQHGNSEERRGGPPMWAPGPGGPGFGGPDGPRGPGQLPPPPAGSTAPTPPAR